MGSFILSKWSNASGWILICESIINSSRASPTPSFGIIEYLKANSGWPTFIIILVLGLFRFLILVILTLNFKIPLYTRPSSPLEQSTVISLPCLSILVAFLVPTTQGIPSSLEIIAAWQVLPPVFVTIALACFIIGTQSGSVISVTSTLPGMNFSISLTWSILQIFPAPILLPTLVPLSIVSLFSRSSYCSTTFTSSLDLTVSGLAWRINNLFVFLSNAHSISIGRL